MKQCTICGLYKDESEFYSEKRNGNGLTANCKSCHKQKVSTPNDELIIHEKLIWKFCLQCITLIPLKPKKTKYCNVCKEIRERELKLSNYHLHELHRSLMIPWQADFENEVKKSLYRAKAHLMFEE